jgi:adenylosuccinate synthase
MVDLVDEEVFRRKLKETLVQKNMYLTQILKEEPFEFSKIFEEFLQYKKKLERYVRDTSLAIYEEIQKRKNVVFEGAQGALLDLDHGTYPYVTSSNTVAGNACVGSGVGPTMIDSVMGVAKAYTTRVGEGPFPTELFDQLGEKIRATGGEYGSTTGRPRRVGWFDANIVRHSVRMSDIRKMTITKLDVLSGFEKIKVCVGYRMDGKVIETVPSNLDLLNRCEPVYEELDGWKTEIKGLKEVSDLPGNAQRYLRRIEELIGAKIEMVSVGSERNETLGVRDPFLDLT